jgi:hypothetical protein
MYKSFGERSDSVGYSESPGVNDDEDNFASESEYEQEDDTVPVPSVSTMSKQCQLDLEFLTDRTRMSRLLGKNSVFGSSSCAPSTDAHKMRKYDKYIQSKLKRLRTTVDKNYQIQRTYDALMREIIADVERRLENLQQPNQEDSMFATVYNSEDEYILEVDQVEKERSELRHADQIRVVRTF